MVQRGGVFLICGAYLFLLKPYTSHRDPIMEQVGNTWKYHALCFRQNKLLPLQAINLWHRFLLRSIKQFWGREGNFLAIKFPAQASQGSVSYFTARRHASPCWGLNTHEWSKGSPDLFLVLSLIHWITIGNLLNHFSISHVKMGIRVVSLIMNAFIHICEVL